jgi:L-alanine-DL-glutamate epimerase-like enolase superfamily enzyme
MIIAKIETLALRVPFKSGTAAAASAWGGEGSPAADALLVRVTTDQGLEGWGESFGFRVVSSTKLAIDELIAPRCVGRDATQIGPLMLDVQKKLHVFGRGGPLFYGISAVDIALWDIAGKAAGVPVYRLLGGSAATELPCYASLIRHTDPELVRANVRRVLGSGFHCVKLHEIELPAIRAAREEAGTDLELALDVNCPWTLVEARNWAAQLEELHLKWLEEPLWPPENYDGLARLRRACGIPIAAGENSSTLMDFERLLAAEAVDYLQPSVAKMGGITELLKVFAIGAIRNVAVVPHCFYDGPGLLAAIHVTAALDNADAMIEWRDFDLEAQLYGGALAPVKGRIAVPQGPGLGIDPDPDVIRDYLLTGTGSRRQRRA